MCGPKGYCFSAVLVIDRVSILADLGHFGHKLGMVFVETELTKAACTVGVNCNIFSNISSGTA